MKNVTKDNEKIYVFEIINLKWFMNNYLFFI